MKNFLKNKNNEEATGSTLVVLFFTSLLISSILISWFLLQIYGVSVTGIELPTEAVYYPSRQDFSTNLINESQIQTSSGSIWQYNEGIGRILTQKGVHGGYVYLLINNIQPDNEGIITNTYHINNSVKQDYTIVLRYTGGSDQNEITFTNNGVHVPNYLLNIVISSPLVISSPNINQIEDVIITTIYNDKEKNVDVIFNGKIFSISGLNPDTNLFGFFGRYYGGVVSNTLGFTIKDFNTENTIIQNPDTSITALLTNMLVIIFKLLLWNIDEKYLPALANILLIKTQIIGLTIGVITWFRSG